MISDTLHPPLPHRHKTNHGELNHLGYPPVFGKGHHLPISLDPSFEEVSKPNITIWRFSHCTSLVKYGEL